MRYVLITAALLAGCGGRADCIVRAEPRADGSVDIVDANHGDLVARCDAGITSCVQASGAPVDASLFRDCLAQR